MKSFAAAITLILALLFLPNISATAAVSAGAACTQLGQTSIPAGIKFTCIKSGKKLVWDKGVKVAPPVAKPTLSSESDFSASIECKLSKPASNPSDEGPDGSVGFPMMPSELSSTGMLKGLILFVDFPDAVAKGDLKAPWQKSSIPTAEKLFSYASFGKLTLNIDLSAKIYRMAKPSTYYALAADPSGGPLPGSPPPKLDEVVTDALTLADADIDFSQYAFVTVSTPASPTIALSGVTGMGPNVMTFDGITYSQGDFIPLDSITPTDDPLKVINFSHDIGHMLGLMHPYVDRSDIHGAWDVMWSFAFQRDFLGWNKWKLNWVTDDQISCVTSESKPSVTQLLSPIGATSKDKKMVVIKLSATSALVVEVRRKSPSENLKVSDEGVIVYRVDTTKGQGLGAFTIASNTSKTIAVQKFTDILGTMKPGQSVTDSGYKVSVLQSGDAGDYVSIKKLA
jgi:M6 family metalloprotease-like protein